MQPIRKITIIFSFLFLSIILRAQEGPPLTAEISQPDSTALKFCLKVSAPVTKRITLSIYSEQQGLVFSRDYHTASFKHSLDFSAVEDGIYAIEITCGKEKIQRRVSIATRQWTTRNATME